MYLAEDALAVFGEADRRQIAEEIAANPSFGKRLVAALGRYDGERLVVLSARKAIANEFDPSLYPETKGEWLTLRKRAVELARALPDIVGAEIDKLPLAVRMQMVRAIGEGHHPSIAVAGMGDLGQFEIIGSLVSSIAGAASSIYSARVTASAQQSIAKIQAQTAMKDLETQMTIASATQAIAKAKAAQATAEATKAQAEVAKVEAGTVVGVLTKDIGAGIPLWVVPVALGVLGLVLYFVFRK